MEEGQERDTSPDDHAHVIDDNDDKDSPTDTPHLWMPEKRGRHQVCENIGGCYSDQEAPTTSVGAVVDCSTSEKDFQRTGEGWYGHTDFVSHRQILVRCSE